jgi:hypothetical protein
MERRGCWQDGERETERERVRGGVLVERVAAWVINLTAGQVFMRVWRWDNPGVYQDEH